MLNELNKLIGKDYTEFNAKEFSDLVCSYFKIGKIQQEVFVPDRYDGRTGRVDIVYTIGDRKCAIELDRFSPRDKSIFKLKQLDVDERYVITRSPFKITRIL